MLHPLVVANVDYTDVILPSTLNLWLPTSTSLPQSSQCLESRYNLQAALSTLHNETIFRVCVAKKHLRKLYSKFSFYYIPSFFWGFGVVYHVLYVFRSHVVTLATTASKMAHQACQPASVWPHVCVCVCWGACVFRFSFVFLMSHRLPCDKISFSPFFGQKRMWDLYIPNHPRKEVPSLPPLSDAHGTSYQ